MKLARLNYFLLAVAITATLAANTNPPSSVLAVGIAVVSVSAPSQAVGVDTQFTNNLFLTVFGHPDYHQNRDILDAASVVSQ